MSFVLIVKVLLNCFVLSLNYQLAGMASTIFAADIVAHMLLDGGVIGSINFFFLFKLPI